jgi:hypothetical protein
MCEKAVGNSRMEYCPQAVNKAKNNEEKKEKVA